MRIVRMVVVIGFASAMITFYLQSAMKVHFSLGDDRIAHQLARIAKQQAEKIRVVDLRTVTTRRCQKS